MVDLDRNKLRRLDVTLLLIFLGILRHGKASAVAKELGLTAPSISHALARLRDIFDDPLFLRRPHGLEPTAFARAIEPDIHRAVDALQASLAGPDAFDPATSAAHLRLSARDSEVAATLPDALCHMFERAPHLSLTVQSLPGPAAARALLDGTLDLAMGFFGQGHDDLEATHLRRETYLVAGRAGHPLLQGPLTLAQYLEADHALVAADASRRGIVDDKLAESGQARRVVLSLPQFLPTLAVLSRSNLIATLPARLVERHADRFGLVAKAPPLAVRSFDIKLLRHRRDLRNPAVTWCIDQIVESV
ncbi:MAG: LysR family transcriptional regulator [Pseudomonadota bacterium]